MQSTRLARLFVSVYPDAKNPGKRPEGNLTF
jgi:hypothetical protein